MNKPKNGAISAINITRKLDLHKIVITLLAGISLVIIVLIFIFVFAKAFPVIQASGAGLFTHAGFDSQISEAFYSPDDSPMLVFGLLGLIAGTFVANMFALILASMLSIGASVAICEFSNKQFKSIFINIMRLLAAIPSVVYGLIGLIVIVPAVEKLFVTVDLQIEYLEYFQITGRNLLSCIIVLTFMIIPTIVSLSIDAIKAVPHSVKEIGYSFGMSHFRVIWKIILPCSKSGIISGIILGAGRGIGEAIAVSMVCGGLGVLPKLSFGLVNLLAPVLPLAAAIVNKSEAMGSYAVESVLFACGAMLLIFGAALSITARIISHRLNKNSVGR